MIELQQINIGTTAGDGTGDPGRVAFGKVNNNSLILEAAIEDAELKSFVVSVSGNKTDIAVEDDVKSFRMPYAFVLLEVRATANDAPTGDDIVVDILDSGYSILDSAGLIIPDGEETSMGVSPAPLAEPIILTDWTKITIDVVQVGSTNPGQGLDVQFLGYVIWVTS